MISFLFLLAFNLFLILNLKRISGILNIYDYPDGKLKLHKKKIPIAGGYILSINFTLIFLYQILYLKKFFIFDIESIQNIELLSLLILLLLMILLLL